MKRNDIVMINILWFVIQKKLSIVFFCDYRWYLNICHLNTQANMLLSNITISPYHDLLSHNVFAQLLSDAGPNITLKNIFSSDFRSGLGFNSVPQVWAPLHQILMVRRILQWWKDSWTSFSPYSHTEYTQVSFFILSTTITDADRACITQSCDISDQFLPWTFCSDEANGANFNICYFYSCYVITQRLDLLLNLFYRWIFFSYNELHSYYVRFEWGSISAERYHCWSLCEWWHAQSVDQCCIFFLCI